MRPCATGLRKTTYLRRFSTSTPRVLAPRLPLPKSHAVVRLIGSRGSELGGSLPLHCS
jgi:hypothetical protein